MPPRRLASSTALVALALDNNMVYAFFVLVHSLRTRTRRPFSLLIGFFPGQLKERHQRLICEVLDRWGVSYTLQALTPSPLFTERRHLTITTFSKFVIADMVTQPHVWLDIDTISREGWDDIFDEIDNAPVGASLVVASPLTSPHTRFDGFNAGVLGWTQEPRVPWEGALAALPEKRFSSEQYLFNTLYAHSVHFADTRFNFLSSWHEDEAQRERASIVHYSGPIKPWHLHRRHREAWKGVNRSWEYWFEAESAMRREARSSAYQRSLERIGRAALFSGRLHLGKGFLAGYVLKALAILGPGGDPLVRLIARRGSP